MSVSLLLLVPVFAQAQLGASLAMRALRPIVAAAIEGSSDKVQDADPFVFSVIYFVEGKEQKAGNSFVAGLINNDINDEETVNKILNSVAGVSVAGGIALSMAGNDDVGRRLAQFGVFVRASSYYSRWRQAIAEGKTVRIVNDEMVITGGESDGASSVVAKKQAEESVGYRETKENEVLPYLNLIHNTPGATIYLDDEEVAVSKYDQYMFDGLPAGLHEISVRDKYAQGTLTVFVNPGRKTDTGFDEMEIEMSRGEFLLSVDPGIAGLPVSVDGEEVGVTPIEGLGILAGERTVSIESEWNDRVEWTVDGFAGASVVLGDPIRVRGAIKLSPLVSEDFRVVVDGQQLEFSYDPIYLSLGPHRIQITGEVIRPWDETVNVAAGRATRIDPAFDYRTGRIALQPFPQAAAIALDGVVLAQDPEALLAETIIGEHHLAVMRLDKSGNLETDTALEFDVSVQEGRTVMLPIPGGEVVLENVPSDGKIHIVGAEDFALRLGGQTVVDEGDEPVSQTLSIDGLLPGEYEIVLGGSSLAEESVTVQVVEETRTSAAFSALRVGGVTLLFDETARYELFAADGTLVESDRGLRGLAGRFAEGDYVLRVARMSDSEWGLYYPLTIEPGGRSGATLQVPFSPQYRLREVDEEIAAQEARLTGKRRRRIISFVGAGVTALAGVTSEMFAGQVVDNYDAYVTASTTSAAVAAREDTESGRRFMNGALVATGVVGTASAILYATSTGSAGVRENIVQLRAEERQISADLAETMARRAQYHLEAGR